ncbi:MAG: hypothetical protein WBG46_03540 [Nonlabens sp.]
MDLKSFILIIIFACFPKLEAQERSFDLLADDFYGVDDFEAVYYSFNNALYKTVEGKKTQFYDIQLGDLTYVDLINPLKVLLFYKDTQTVVLLDNRLNESERIILSNIKPYRYIEHVRLAGERRLWLYDLDQNRVQLYNYINNTVIVSTPSLKINVENLHTDYNFCHIQAADQIQSFNSYGSRTHVLKLDATDRVAYDFERLVVIHENDMNLYGFDKEFRFRESEKTNTLIPIMDIKSLYLKAGKLYLWNGKKVQVYLINPEKK